MLLCDSVDIVIIIIKCYGITSPSNKSQNHTLLIHYDIGTQKKSNSIYSKVFVANLISIELIHLMAIGWCDTVALAYCLPVYLFSIITTRGV